MTLTHCLHLGHDDDGAGHILTRECVDPWPVDDEREPEYDCTHCAGRGYHTHGVDLMGRPWPDCGCCAGRGYHRGAWSRGRCFS
jgi:hypothetical protein